MINSRLVNICLISLGTLSLVFILFPRIDLEISKLFFSESQGFILKDQALVVLLFRSIPVLTELFALFCLIHLIYTFIKSRDIKKLILSWSFFLLISAVLAPGLTVNTVLKENFGRARPREIVEFGGKSEFTRAAVISDQCTKNCSFPSGHAAMGFYFSAIAYVLRASRFSYLYISAIIFGTIVGLSRIVMGAHFASDVVISGFVVLAINHCLYLLWHKIKYPK
ncbi:MAG: phosphatase PAP2 family protein [Rickettsiales bacterium]|nr:phosphatase PAP2 family protein [Rickettsiales bacterium]MCA0254458.1 phosphatase PAP2 family protein [Pseudomonadota bacterium]